MRVCGIVGHLDHHDRLGGECILCLNGEMLAKMFGRKMAQRSEPDFGAGYPVRAGLSCQVHHSVNHVADQRSLMHVGGSLRPTRGDNAGNLGEDLLGQPVDGFGDRRREGCPDIEPFALDEIGNEPAR